MRICAIRVLFSRSTLRGEQGSISVLTVFMFVAMLMVAGLAVDMMRYESERARLQGVTDRAVLAAAMMRDTPANPSPEAIVRSYFAAEGLEHLLDREGAITVRTVGNAREVMVTPQTDMRTMFMRLSGIDSLPMQVSAGASESLAQINFEIVMVLDLSGSMGDPYSRITNLRAATRDFVTNMLEDSTDGRVAITFVPYSTEVVMPAGTLSLFNNLDDPPSGDLTNAYCVDFREWDTVTDSINTPMFRRNCVYPLDHAPVRPFIHDLDQALAITDTLSPFGTTSIDLGVRVGGLFFDPTLRPIIEHLIDAEEVSPIFAQRPLDWNAPAKYRAMIIMTDGFNCCFGNHEPRANRKPTLEIQDADTIATCNALKAQNIRIYAVAFEAPPEGVALMEACASAPSYFFNSSGTELVNAFRQIATHMQSQALRLTQ